MDAYKTLSVINVNDHKDDKNGLSYLSWTWAVDEVMKKYPDMTYKIWRGENNLPYVYDEKTGYMVFTSVTIDGQTKEMWLAVMDNNNKAMKKEAYKYMNKYGKEKTVEPASMTDINRAIMRCLTKNFAMFGLGLYIYAGEDLPESDEEQEKPKKQTAKKTADDQPKEPEQNQDAVKEAELKTKILAYINKNQSPADVVAYIKKSYRCTPAEMKLKQCEHFIETLKVNGKEI